MCICARSDEYTAAHAYLFDNVGVGVPHGGSRWPQNQKLCSLMIDMQIPNNKSSVILETYSHTPMHMFEHVWLFVDTTMMCVCKHIYVCVHTYVCMDVCWMLRGFGLIRHWQTVFYCLTGSELLLSSEREEIAWSECLLVKIWNGLRYLYPQKHTGCTDINMSVHDIVANDSFWLE